MADDDRVRADVRQTPLLQRVLHLVSAAMRRAPGLKYPFMYL